MWAHHSRGPYHQPNTKQKAWYGLEKLGHLDGLAV